MGPHIATVLHSFLHLPDTVLVDRLVTPRAAIVGQSRPVPARRQTPGEAEEKEREDKEIDLFSESKPETAAEKRKVPLHPMVAPFLRSPIFSSSSPVVL